MLIGGSIVATIWLDKISGAPECLIRSYFFVLTLMEHTETTGLDYAGGKISRLFSKIFFPTLLGMIFNALITIIDGVFVGRSVGPDGIAAVNIIAPLFMVVTGCGLMFGIGSSVIAGIAIARGDVRRASVSTSQACVFSLMLISALTASLLLFRHATARLLGCSDELMPHAIDYLTWLIPGIFFLIFECIGMMVIRLDGSPKFAMYCNIIPAVTNIALDYYLVFPCGMGVKGAAIATSASIAIGAAMVLVYFMRFSYIIKFRWSSRGFAANCMRQIRIGSSAFITEIAMSVMMLTGNYVFMQYYGDTGVAAFSIACYLFPRMFMISNAVAQSAQPIISYNYGAGATNRVSHAFRLSLKVAALCGLISFASIALGARQIVSLFISPDCPAGRLATAGLPVYSVCALFFAVNISFIGYYQSIEKALKAMVLTLMRGIVVLVPMFLLLPRIAPDWGVWAAIPLSEASTLAIICATNLLSARKSARFS